jgi:hypothetical protein
LTAGLTGHTLRRLRRTIHIRQRAVLIFVCALVLLVGWAVGSSASARGATVDAGTFTLPIDTLLPCGVGGETIELTGTGRYHFAFVTDSGDGLHLTFGGHENLTGTGLTTGLSYRRPGTFMDSIQLTGGGTQVITHVTNARLTGPNGTVVSVLRSMQVTVDGTTVRDVTVQFFCA